MKLMMIMMRMLGGLIKLMMKMMKMEFRTFIIIAKTIKAMMIKVTMLKIWYFKSKNYFYNLIINNNYKKINKIFV